MSRRSTVRAVYAAAGLLGIFAAGSASAQQTITIDVTTLNANNCVGQVSCTVQGVALSTVPTSRVLTVKTLNNVSGFGVSGGASGNEIDIGETLHVGIGQARNVKSIKFLFLFNGSEFNDRAEIASVVADGTTYTLAVSSIADNSATWSGPGTVSNCGATTALGTGCFTVTNPFPAAVSQLDFGAVHGGTPFAGTGTNDSDYAIGSIEIESQIVVELQDCTGVTGCPVIPPVDGHVAFNLNGVQAQNPGGSTEAIVIPVTLPDCRYIPKTCLIQLTGSAPATDDAARNLLITMNVIKPLDPTGPDKLSPGAELLNATKLLPVEVTSQFDSSGTPPAGLPPLYIGSRWKGQSGKGHLIHGYFFKTDSGLKFTDVFEGLIDVSVLTGNELGCVADTGNLLAWDVISTASELAKSVGGQYIDSIINVGCINPTKVAGTRLSLYSIDLELAKDTYGPTITSKKPKLTLNNDAVFARLVETQWKDLGEIRANYACKQADPNPTGGQAPLSAAVCSTLATLWSDADKKINDCVVKTFKPITGLALGICELARDTYVNAFEAALPAVATGPDPYNRLGELHNRVAVFEHVWDTRFLASLKVNGYCREKGTCSP